jgi:hypothetical protein
VDCHLICYNNALRIFYRLILTLRNWLSSDRHTGTYLFILSVSFAVISVRGMFVDLMGYSTAPLHIHAVKLAQSPALLHR